MVMAFSLVTSTVLALVLISVVHVGR